MQPTYKNNMKNCTYTFHLSLNYSDSQVMGSSPTWAPLRSSVQFSDI